MEDRNERLAAALGALSLAGMNHAALDAAYVKALAEAEPLRRAAEEAEAKAAALADPRRAAGDAVEAAIEALAEFGVDHEGAVRLLTTSLEVVSATGVALSTPSSETKGTRRRRKEGGVANPSVASGRQEPEGGDGGVVRDARPADLSASSPGAEPQELVPPETVAPAVPGDTGLGQGSGLTEEASEPDLPALLGVEGGGSTAEAAQEGSPTPQGEGVDPSLFHAAPPSRPDPEAAATPAMAEVPATSPLDEGSQAAEGGPLGDASTAGSLARPRSDVAEALPLGQPASPAPRTVPRRPTPSRTPTGSGEGLPGMETPRPAPTAPVPDWLAG